MNKHFYTEKSHPEIKRGLLGIYDTHYENFYSLTTEDLTGFSFSHIKDDGSIEVSTLAGIKLTKNFAKNCFHMVAHIRNAHDELLELDVDLTLNNLLINSATKSVTYYDEEFFARMIAASSPSLIDILHDNAKKFKFQVKKTVRTLKFAKDMLVHTLIPFTVDCPHRDMNLGMQEVLWHMMNHFFAGDILLVRHFENVSNYEGTSKGLTIYIVVEPLRRANAIRVLRFTGTALVPEVLTVPLIEPDAIVDFYSSDRFSYRDVASLAQAFKDETAYPELTDELKSRFFECADVQEYYYDLEKASERD